jgi:hypothetical protein
MTDYTVSYLALGVQPPATGRRIAARLKAIPWARIALDAALVAGLVLASSKLFAP